MASGSYLNTLPSKRGSGALGVVIACGDVGVVISGATFKLILTHNFFGMRARPPLHVSRTSVRWKFYKSKYFAIRLLRPN